MDNTMAFDIATKKVDITSSGSQPFAWPTMLDGVNPTLLGYKVRLSAAIADKAAGAKAIAFGNPGEYVIGERGPMKIKRLQLSEYGDTFAFAQRIDGKPLNAAAFVVVALHA
jgi:HK97 family phage major capsid protein